LPADLVALATRAVRDCPRRAITLTRKKSAAR
jgi:ferredoxin